VLFLIGLGQQELRLEEPHRVEPALAMIKSGNWAVPMIGGESYFRKPPLFNWLIAASFLTTGSLSEFTARLPSALMVLLLALAICATGRSWLGREGAFGAGLIVLTSVAMVDKGRLAEIEVTYVALTGMACAVWLEGWARQHLSGVRWMLTGAFLGLAFLVKGPPHLAFFSALVLLCLGWSGTRTELVRGQFWLGVGALLLPAVLWLVLLGHRWPEAATVWRAEMTERFTPEVSWQRLLVQAAGNPVSSILNLMPWILLAFALFPRTARQSLPDPQKRFVWAAAWLALVSIVLLPMVPGYRPRYSMPAYGPVMMARAIGGESLRAGAKGWRIWWVLGAAGSALVALGGLVGAVLASGSARWVVLGGAALAGGIAVWAQRSAATRLQLWRGSAMVAIALGLVLLPLLMPRLASRARLRPAANRVMAFVPPGQKLYLFRPGHLRFLFYLWGRVELLRQARELPAQELVLLTTASEAEALSRLTGRTVHLLGEEPPFRILKLGVAP
jgi:4-amino-4-deoxy-L-arabinose transferase-like glycosyltransferase